MHIAVSAKGGAYMLSCNIGCSKAAEALWCYFRNITNETGILVLQVGCSMKIMPAVDSTEFLKSGM